MNFNELFQKMRELDAPVSEELKGNQDKLDADKDGDIEASCDYGGAGSSA